jgi:hypothetical protein
MAALSQAVGDCGWRLEVVERAVAQVHAGIDRMHVAVLKARQHHSPVEIDHLGFGAHQSSWQVVSPDIDDSLIADGDRAGPASRGVHRVDESVAEHEVGRSGPRQRFLF